MVGEAKQRQPRPKEKEQNVRKRKKGSSEKHKLPLAEQMEDTHEFDAKTKTGKNRKVQETEDYVNPKTSNKILAEARRQQQEIEHERDEETGLAAARRAFSTVSVNKKISAEIDSDDEEGGGFSDTEAPPEEIEEISEEEEKIMAMFMAVDAGPQRTLADMIMQRIQEKEAVASEAENAGGPPVLDARVTEVYTGVGKLLSRYRAGKLPKAFKIVPSLCNWEEILALTEPHKWTPNAMYEATRMFASNLNARMAQRFYNLVLLPHVREDIQEHKRLHFATYQALKKAMFKPSAFYKGILLPLCQSRTCNLREAVIIGSVIEKVSIPVLHSSVALLKMSEMEYCGTTSYFMKLLMNKKYALPYRVLDGLVAHFVRFTNEERDLPVIWHQCLLTLVQRYKNELSEEDKENLKRVMRQHRHYLVTPEIHRELQHSRHRGQKGGGVPSVQAPPPGSTSKQAMEEDIWNLPEVEIEMEG
ncbi:unnamed protein product [Calypogeia fissa]